MSAGIYNITVEQGATLDLRLTVTEPTGLKDLTGYTAHMQIRREIDDSGILLDLTDANGKLELGGVLGTIRIIVSAVDTAALASSGVYDLELTAPDGTVERLI